MHRFHAFVLALALAAPACSHEPSSIVVHTAADAQHALTATGNATIAVKPDCADLTLTVSSEAARPAEALAAARKREDALLASLKRLGVADADLALSTLGVDAVYRDDGGRSRLDGFRAHVTITAITRAFDRIGALMEAAADAGVTEMSSRFRRSDLETIRKQVRDQALAAAQAKAKETAGALGIALGHITSVSDASPSFLYSNEYFPSGGGTSGVGVEAQPLTIAVTLTYDI